MFFVIKNLSGRPYLYKMQRVAGASGKKEVQQYIGSVEKIESAIQRYKGKVGDLSG